MILEQFYLVCLSQASYLLGDESTGVGWIVDPRRDVDEYIERAKALGLRIEHVLLTHFHADFVSGHLELQSKTGARIHLSEVARADYGFEPLADGQVLQSGSLRIVALATPGHTPESVCFVVYDLAKGEAPIAVLTGDTLFLGDVGRPDLMSAAGMSATDLAMQLHASLHDKLLKLPDATLVYPGHGAGSSCGKNLSTDRVSPLGVQRKDNRMLQPMSAAEFAALATADLPAAPPYFRRAAEHNRRLRPTLDTSAMSQRALSRDEVLACQQEGMQVLDVRSPAAFAAGHLEGSIHVGLDGRFAGWVGTFIDGGRPLVLIAPPGREQEAALRLGRVGLDQIHGYLAAADTAALTTAPASVRMRRMTAQALAAELATQDPPLVVDIRERGERADSCIAGSLHLPLPELDARANELPRHRRLVLQCGSGYRSTIGASLALRHGYANLSDLEGGMAAWLVAFPAAASPNPQAPTRRNPERTMEPTCTTGGIPRIGDQAPDFTAVSTQGELTLSKWQDGKWVMLFSHPADFTPVCSTELTEFAKRSGEFAQRNCKLLGLSIDSVHSHLAWIENLKQIMNVSIDYPLLADLDMKVAMAYGMLHPGASSTATVRSVFLIDPKRTIRALVYYPMSVGRNCDELLRLIDGLQTTEKHGCATPVNWKPGEKVIVPPPKTAADVAERKTHKEYERLDFYLNKRELPLDKLRG